MRLVELLKGVETLEDHENLECDVSMICSDSRKIRKNGAFIAINGEKRNGNEYITDALNLGAKAIITDEKDAFNKFKEAILVNDSRKALSYMWNNYYKNPSSKMKVVAITGTNGKTSCAYYLYNILKSAGENVGLISTIECLVNGEQLNTNGGSDVLDIHSAMTTPDPEILFEIFQKMKEKGVKVVVMEASSHALKLSKLSSLRIDYAIFTNLSSEHLDFHKNMEDYYASKKKLFQSSVVGIVNIDDTYGKRLSREIDSLYTCSLKGVADFSIKEFELNEKGYSYDADFNGIKETIKGKQIGEFSIYNSFLSASCAYLMGIDLEKIKNGLLNIKSINGRLERIENTNIFIDYAHTPAAMENILKTIKSVYPKKRILSLFGCGGDRDKGKRAKMGEISSQMADFTIVTSDNSRTEEPLQIIQDILKGINSQKPYAVIPNREKAILYAIAEMKNDDILILFGKGHEQYEIDKNGKRDFDEREIIHRALKNDKNKKI